MDAKTQTKPPPRPQEAPAKEPTDPLDAILERARQGDETALPELKQVLDDNPSIWRDSFSLVALSERAWLQKIAANDLLAFESIRRQVEQLKLDLIGTAPAPLEKLLADRIAASWLGVQHAEMGEAFGDASGGKVAKMRLTQLESAHKRFLSAVRALAISRRLTNGLKIEINHSGQSTTREAESRPGVHAARPNGVRERLRTLFDEEATDAKDLAVEVTP
jgi:hypothetical protein